MTHETFCSRTFLHCCKRSSIGWICNREFGRSHKFQHAAHGDMRIAPTSIARKTLRLYATAGVGCDKWLLALATFSGVLLRISEVNCTREQRILPLSGSQAMGSSRLPLRLVFQAVMRKKSWKTNVKIKKSVVATQARTSSTIRRSNKCYGRLNGGKSCPERRSDLRRSDVQIILGAEVRCPECNGLFSAEL